MTATEGEAKVWLTPERVLGPMRVDELDDYELKFWSRLRVILTTALENAPVDDLLDRQRHIERTGFFGWTVWAGLQVYEYHLGGRLLVEVPVSLFSDDAFLEPVPMQERRIPLDGEVTGGPAPR